MNTLVSLSTEELNLVRFWRNCLADERLVNLTRDFKEVSFFESSQLQKGKVDSAPFYRYHKKHYFNSKEESSGGKTSAQPSMPDRLTIIITPFRARKKHVHASVFFSKDNSVIYPLWLIASIDQKGNLYPPTDYILPWIPRDLLSPAGNNLTLGSIDSLDEFLNGNKLVSEEGKLTKISWSDYLEYAQTLLKETTHNQWRKCLTDKNYIITDRPMGFLYRDEAIMAKSVMNIYDTVLAEKKAPLLLRHYLSLATAKREPLITDNFCIQTSKEHLGQMNGHFALTNSQREALTYHLLGSAHHSLAINGPPGTGKTTLIQSMVASHWVKAAIAHAKPPIVVVSSANNQAVTNVIESFSTKKSKKTRLEQRWIESISSYGLYLVADRKVKSAVGKYEFFQDKAESNHHQSVLQHYNQETIAQKPAIFLKKCSSHFKKEIRTLDEAISIIHAKMVQLQQSIGTQIDEARLFVKVKEQYPQLKDEATRLPKQIEKFNQELKKFNAILFQWLQYEKKHVWKGLLSFVKFFKEQLSNDITLFCLEHQLDALPADSTAVDVRHYLKQQVAHLKESVATYREKLNTVQKTHRQYEPLIKRWQSFMHKHDINGVSEFFNMNSDHNLLAILDKTTRYELFLYAIHYWEARWLTALPAYFKKAYWKGQFEEERLNLYQIHAMLFPCFVATLHSLPNFFKYKATISGYHYMPEVCDLLILDEAAQVTPALSGGSMALAKRAVFIGDNAQIEPITGLNFNIEWGNMQQAMLGKTLKDLKQLARKGIISSPVDNNPPGSAMRIAQRLSPIQEQNLSAYKKAPPAGALLKEHFRSVPEIIAFCNTLAYNNTLIPKRYSIKNYPWPHLGYAYIAGMTDTKEGSRYNDIEASALVNWLVANQERLQNYYQCPLSDIVGIITPFRAQKDLLIAKVKKAGLLLAHQKIGTVHAFQGAQMPMMIFSPVHTTAENRRCFFDRSINMLNVALSRAQDSFLVFGDIDVFDPDNTAVPSGLLASYLLAKPENEIIAKSIIVPKCEHFTAIDTLEEHRDSLKNSIIHAKHSVMIVSPFINLPAVKSDDILNLINENRHKNITIYTDYHSSIKKSNHSHQKAQQQLRQAGAHVKIVHRLHAKILAIDDNQFIEGSFNWLSASRKPEFANYEFSLVYSNKDAHYLIKRVKSNLEDRLI